MSNINEIFKLFLQKNPNPQTELDYTNPFTLAVAVILSAQTTDKGVNKATKALFEEISTPSQMLALGEDGLKNYIKTIGLFNSKAANIIKFSKMLADGYNEELPLDKTTLESFPGIGRKTANVILTVLTDAETFPVDTHVARLSNRLGFTKETNPLKIEADLERLVPQPYRKNAHHWLVLHGRYICKAPKPKCHECYLTELCPSFKTMQI
jgi:endonuclease-3